MESVQTIFSSLLLLSFIFFFPPSDKHPFFFPNYKLELKRYDVCNAALVGKEILIDESLSTFLRCVVKGLQVQ